MIFWLWRPGFLVTGHGFRPPRDPYEQAVTLATFLTIRQAMRTSLRGRQDPGSESPRSGS